MIKALTEEYSFTKNSALLSKEMQKIASNDKGLDIYAFTQNGVVLYANKTSLIGKKVLNRNLYLNHKQSIKIYKEDDHLVKILVNILYLYNPFTKNIQRGHLLLVQNIKNKLHEANGGMITILAWLFIIATFAVLVLFYLFNKIFIEKIKKIETISIRLTDDAQAPTTLNGIIKRLESTTLKLNLLSKVVEYSNDSVIITDANRHIISVNKAFERITGYTTKEVIGKNPKKVFSSGMMSEDFYQNMYAAIDQHGRFEGEVLNRRKDGTNYLAWINVWALQDGKTQQTTNSISISKDLTEILNKQKEIERLAYFDTLTGLVNREYFLKLLNEIITVKERKQEALALISVDIDAFKEINDTLGHKKGDVILQAFGLRLKELFSAEDVIARIGGDEFAILLIDTIEPSYALEAACKIQDITIKGKKDLQVSIGIAMYPKDGDSSDALLAAGDIAMNYSKQSQNIKCTLFNAEMQKIARDKITLKEELGYAIKHNELRLFYQPKFSVKNKKLRGFEALIRWEHPKKRFIYPDAFIPLAEESGLIIPMTSWIFKQVSKSCKIFSEIYPYFGSIAINISAKHFNTLQLIDEIKSSISKEYLQAGRVDIEITESVVMNRFSKINMQLSRLRDMGIKIALDDYGTGYSSLIYLKNLPIDIIKVDKSFVDGLCYNQEDYAIVKSTIDLAKSLGLQTVIEGVEDEKQVAVLKQLKADLIQGYVYSKPLSQVDTEALLTSIATGI